MASVIFVHALFTNIDLRVPLGQLCLQNEAQRRQNGLSAVPADIVAVVLTNTNFWARLNQLVKVAKPLVDAIGNLESHDANLADCMLEMIRCARDMTRLPFDGEEDSHGFWLHAKTVFNRRFHIMNTPIHSLALFLHPLARRLAISQAASGRTLPFLIKTALEIAQQWRWKKENAEKLITDLKMYSRCEGAFAGGQADGIDWWKGLLIDANNHPLKIFAIRILSIVPHAADVERLFSQLGGVQSVKRCNLSVENFERMGKLRCNYSFHLFKQDRKAGKSTRRQHAHMHTHSTPGIDNELVNELQDNFSWTGPLATETPSDDGNIEGPESVSLDEIDAAFAALESEVQLDIENGNTGPGGSSGVLAGGIYDFGELDKLDKGLAPLLEPENVMLFMGEAGQEGGWCIGNLLVAEGLGE